MAAAGTTVAGVWGAYLAANRRRLAPATSSHRNRCVRAFLDWCPVDDPNRITPALAARYAAHRAEGGLAPLSVSSELAALHAVFGWAVRKGLVKRNPFDRVNRLPARQRRPPRVLSDDEIARLLRVARGSVFHDVIYTFLRTGASTREMAALRWEDVDFERMAVRLGGGVCEGEAQGKLVARSVPMDGELARVLARRPGCPLRRVEEGVPEQAAPEEAVPDSGDRTATEQDAQDTQDGNGPVGAEEEDVCRTTLEILDRLGDALEEAKDRTDPRIARVREGLEELARRRRMLDEGGGPPVAAGDTAGDTLGNDNCETDSKRKLRVTAWLLDSFEGGVHPAAGASEVEADSPYVFPTMLGGARRYNTALGVARCASRAGLGAVTPQVLRHTFAGRLVMNGIDATTLRRLMGFSGARQVACYSHLAPGGKIPRWHATASRRKELARRMRAAVQGSRVPLPGPGPAEVIHRAADILEDVAYFVERERERKKREKEKRRKQMGLPPKLETLLDLLKWLHGEEGEK